MVAVVAVMMVVGVVVVVVVVVVAVMAVMMEASKTVHSGKHSWPTPPISHGIQTVGAANIIMRAQSNKIAALPRIG